MKETTLYGPDSQPIRRIALTQAVATPTVTGVRRVWPDAVATGLTPDRLAGLLKNADQGDHRAAVTLAGEMEKRDLHYFSVLGTRKRAIVGITPTVTPGGEDEKAVEISEAVRQLTLTKAFRGLVIDLLDALGKGFSVCEIMWQRDATKWTPKSFEQRPAWFFQFDKESGRQLRLEETSAPDGVELPPYKFIAHIPKLLSGLPSEGGLGRIAAWAFMFKSYTLRDWMAFIEAYGMPIRVGKYGPSATPEDVEVLVEAVANLGTDSAAVIPESMKVEFVKAGDAKSDAAVFKDMANFLDAQVSKAVLGQTMTADNGSSKSQAQVHDDVRHDIAEADASDLEGTLNDALVRPFVDLNFGPQQVYPAIGFPVVQPEDVEALTNSLTRLVPLGLRVSMQEVRERIGFGEPGEKDDVLTAPAASVAVAPHGADGKPRELPIGRHRDGGGRCCQNIVLFPRCFRS